MSLSQRLRELREQRGLTGRAAATYLKISSAHVSDLENAKAKPSLDLLARLAVYYRTSIDYLLGLTNDPSPTPGSVAEAPALTPEQQQLLEQINDEFTSLSARDQRIALDFLRMMRKAEEEGPDEPLVPRIIGDG
jgi:transcriptional regulator with XRE-family HTH domain